MIELELILRAAELGTVAMSLSGMLMALRSSHITVRELAWLLADKTPPQRVDEAFFVERSGASQEKNA